MARLRVASDGFGRRARHCAGEQACAEEQAQRRCADDEQVDAFAAPAQAGQELRAPEDQRDEGEITDEDYEIMKANILKDI